MPCKNRQRQILATTTHWWGAESSHIIRLGLLLIIWCPHNWHQHFNANFEDNSNLSGLLIELFSIKDTVSWCIILYQYALQRIPGLGCILDMAHDHRRCLKKMSNLRTRPIYINAIVLIHFVVYGHWRILKSGTCMQAYADLKQRYHGRFFFGRFSKNSICSKRQNSIWKQKIPLFCKC